MKGMPLWETATASPSRQMITIVRAIAMLRNMRRFEVKRAKTVVNRRETKSILMKVLNIAKRKIRMNTKAEVFLRILIFRGGWRIPARVKQYRRTATFAYGK